MPFVLFGAALLGGVAFAAETPRAYAPPAPSHVVKVLRDDWRDEARARTVPAKIYFPKDGAEPLPIVIFSHGLGGSREGYEYLGQHWAGCGYVAVHLQHAGSDEHVWKDAAAADPMGAMARAAANPAAIANRPRDVSFAIDQLGMLNADAASPLKGRLDLKRIGVAGHSFGGFTTMAIAGERRIPFDKMTAAETCLVIFKDGDHMIFSGRPQQDVERNKQDVIFQSLICAGSTAFWDARLKGNAAALAWLMDGGFAQQLGVQGTFETKKPAK